MTAGYWCICSRHRLYPGGCENSGETRGRAINMAARTSKTPRESWFSGQFPKLWSFCSRELNVVSSVKSDLNFHLSNALECGNLLLDSSHILCTFLLSKAAYKATSALDKVAKGLTPHSGLGRWLKMLQALACTSQAHSISYHLSIYKSWIWPKKDSKRKMTSEFRFLPWGWIQLASPVLRPCTNLFLLSVFPFKKIAFVGFLGGSVS